MEIEELTNAEPEETAKRVVKLLNAAEDEVWISSRLSPSFYNKPEIQKAFEEVANRITDFRLLLDANVNWETVKSEILWLNDILGRKYATVKQSKEPIPHWLVIDGKHYRFEKSHPEELTVTSNLIVWEVTKPFSDMFKDRFNSWWMASDTIR